MFRFYFHIIDRECNDEYDFDGLFFDSVEVALFIQQNKDVGNTVTCLGYDVVPYTKELGCKFYRY
jgi:hypothetical protein